ncbi:MAG TPA: ribosome small subunit-dependent GTPase A [Ruminococcaceae bacterium]|nr:ribosome small subunit-dependent GTPase A [Oscillospiraceae bacterium]
MRGLIVKALSGFYTVESEGERYVCRARGIFRKKGQSPFAGDTVEFTPAPDEESEGTVDKIIPRTNLLTRPPLANVSRLLIVSSVKAPVPNITLIDKLTAIACDKGITPAVVFNKSDLDDGSGLCSIYEKAGISGMVISCATGEGKDRLREFINAGGITVLTGNSGVGKSSILNALYPRLDLPTGEISEKLGRGRHTTRHVELFKCGGGGYIADTPGFSSMETWRGEVISKENLPLAFPEFASYLGKCRFVSCSHREEKGCAVREAVQSGDIAESRYRSYLAMYDEVKDMNDWGKKR